jgi:hypothetical protein
MSKGKWNKRQGYVKPSKKNKDWMRLRLDAALVVINGQCSQNGVGNLFRSISKWKVRYWIKKIKEDNFHNNIPLGRPKLDAWERTLLFFLAKFYPQSSLTEFVQSHGILTGKYLTRGGICSIFNQWGFSYKKVKHKQHLKYTVENVDKYIKHIISMPLIAKQYGFNRIKYADEVHFVPRCLEKQKAIGPRGKTIFIKRNTNLNETFSMTLLATPGKEIPFIASPNSQYDFVFFLADGIANGYLSERDVLIMDNASVHVGMETFPIVHETLTTLNIN